MNRFEQYILSKIESTLPLLTTIIISALGLYIRFSLRNVLSGDAEKFLLPWYDEIARNGLYKQVGDYNLGYQFLIWAMTKLPLNPLDAYKGLSCFFDYLLASISGLVVYQLSTNDKIWTAILTFSFVLLSPIVFLNSAAWAQCDALFSTFAVLGLLYLEKEKYNHALFALGISFTFKLHAIFILPIYLFIYFTKRKFSIIRFAIIPLTMLAVSMPILFVGRNPFDTFKIYATQTHTYRAMAMNYPSVWLLLCQATNTSHYAVLKTVSISFSLFVLIFLMIWWFKKIISLREKIF